MFYMQIFAALVEFLLEFFDNQRTVKTAQKR